MAVLASGSLAAGLSPARSEGNEVPAACASARQAGEVAATVPARQASEVAATAPALATAFSPSHLLTGAARPSASAGEKIDALVQRSFAAPRDSVPIYCRRAEELLMAADAERALDASMLVRLALVNGRLADFEGNAEKVARVRRVDECCRLAIARDSTDALPYILLGALNYRLSSLSWVERAIASTFIGDLPPTSLVDAERFLRRALRLQGDLPCCHYVLGRTLEAMDRDAEAVDALRLALACAPYSPLDAHYQNMARERLREIEGAHERSRQSWREPGEGGM